MSEPVEFLYRIRICKIDGTTPLSETPSIDVIAPNHYVAESIVLQANPGYETVSWGRADQIDESERKWKYGL